jgi:hypothetical protein
LDGTAKQTEEMKRIIIIIGYPIAYILLGVMFIAYIVKTLAEIRMGEFYGWVYKKLNL